MREETMDNNELQQAVERGAALLDQNQGPHWPRRVKLGKLDIQSCTLCILGQVFGDYEDGKLRLNLSPEESELHGFTSLWGARQDPLLQATWLTLLRKRRLDRLQTGQRAL